VTNVEIHFGVLENGLDFVQEDVESIIIMTRNGKQAMESKYKLIMAKYVTLNGKVIVKPEYKEMQYPIGPQEPTWFEIPIKKQYSIPWRKPYRYKIKSDKIANKEIKQYLNVKRYRRCYTCNKRFLVPDLSDQKYHHCKQCRSES